DAREVLRAATDRPDPAELAGERGGHGASVDGVRLCGEVRRPEDKRERGPGSVSGRRGPDRHRGQYHQPASCKLQLATARERSSHAWNDNRGSAMAARADEGVDRRRLAVVERDGPAHLLAALDRETIQLRDDVLGREENRRVAGPAVAVGEVRRGG